MDGKWTTNYQGGETYCIDGYSYLINNHRVLQKTGLLNLYLICSKCCSRNILCEGKLKKPDHPNHTCDPDPDNFELFEADLHLKHLAASTKHPPSKIQNDLLVSVPHDIKKHLPPTKHMKRRVQHVSFA